MARMEMTLVLNSKQVESIYGYWPSFHDAEILSVLLTRNTESSRKYANAVIDLNYWETKAINEGTSALDYVLDKNMVISLEFGELSSSSIEGFNHQNVIDELIIKESANGIVAEFITIHGAAIAISCKSVAVLGVKPYA
jgi:hypothetical protein